MVPPTAAVVNGASDQTTTKKPNDTLQIFLDQHPSVQVIIVQRVDIAGITRSRLLPVASFRRLVASGGALNSTPLDCVSTSSDELVGPEIFAVFADKGRISSDLSSLRVAAHDGSGIGNAAVVWADVDYRGLDARVNLRNLLDRAEREHGLAFLVGIELEFCFLKPGTLEPAGPAKRGVGHSSYTHRSSIWPILNEAVVALSEAGIDVEQVIKEAGPSAWEMALPPLPPLEAVDAYVHTKEVIKNVAHKHGVVATLYPAPHEADGPPQRVGQHIHISATPVSESVDWDADAAMAGIMSHIPALMAVGQSQLDSYDRVGPGVLCSGGYVGWGDNNRDMPVRRVERSHWEIRTHDATSNPYAMVAGIVSAALDPKPLTIQGMDKWTMDVSDEERERLGVTKLLPTSLNAALEELEKDRAWAEDAFGDDYLKWFLRVKRTDLQKVIKLSAKERRLHMINHF